MENIVPDSLGKSRDCEPEPANTSHAAETIPAPSGSVGSPRDVITICSWCPALHVLRLERRSGDHFVFFVGDEGRLRIAYRSDRDDINKVLTISESICPACAARLTK